MSVRGEFSRLGADLLAALRDAGLAGEGSDAEALDGVIARARDDLSGAAEQALVLLARVPAPGDTELRRRFEAAHERLEAVCRIILGRSGEAAARPREC